MKILFHDLSYEKEISSILKMVSTLKWIEENI